MLEQQPPAAHEDLMQVRPALVGTGAHQRLPCAVATGQRDCGVNTPRQGGGYAVQQISRGEPVFTTACRPTAKRNAFVRVTTHVHAAPILAIPVSRNSAIRAPTPVSRSPNPLGTAKRPAKDR